MFFKVENLSKSYDGKPVLADVSFAVDSGELVSVVGPSGAGKTTLLRMLAGLASPDSGRVDFSRAPSKRNPVIMVFQDYLLFPNLNVFENIAFGLRARKFSSERIREKVMEILSYFQLTEKKGQYPVQLSAGQKQRVAIARAMVVNPSVLLLDEPFANLDPNLKMATAEFIRTTQKRFNITTVSVTHDLDEAFAMSDKIGIMLSGAMVQFAHAGTVYAHPATLSAARFLGPVNELSPEVCPALGLSPDICGPDRIVYTRPEALRMEPDPEGAARVESVAFAGRYIRYRVFACGTRLTVYGLEDRFRAGDRVRVRALNYLTSTRKIS